jgi:hypothetical protein
MVDKSPLLLQNIAEEINLDQTIGKNMSFEQQKAELKRRMMQPAAKKEKAKKLKNVQVEGIYTPSFEPYNPEI